MTFDNISHRSVLRAENLELDHRRLDHLKLLEKRQWPDGISEAEKGRRLQLSMRNFRHGLEDSPTYHSWRAMMQRCYYRKHVAYGRYGGKGIAVCPEWFDFNAFVRDMGIRPPGTSLDRINGSDGYNKSNCRWANRYQQSQNTSENVNITFRGVTKCVQEWANETGMGNTTIFWRLKQGWTPERTITQPVQKRKNNHKPL